MSTKTRDITDYLDDIANAIAEAEEFTSNMNYETFASDWKTVNAVIRSLEALGEATKRLPVSFRQKHPDIPWSKMAGMRDVLIHDHMGVDLKTVWKVVKERLPELKILLVTLISSRRDSRNVLFGAYQWKIEERPLGPIFVFHVLSKKVSK